jgi:hypothetical protein
VALFNGLIGFLQGQGIIAKAPPGSSRESAALVGMDTNGNVLVDPDGIGTVFGGTVTLPGGTGAPANAEYVVAVGDAGIPNARVLTAGANILVSNAVANIASVAFDPTGLSGTYTPTASAFTNMDSVTPAVARWLRLGSIVFVDGLTSFDPTAAAACAFEFTLPVASPGLTSPDLAGGFLMTDSSVAASIGSISGFTANRARFAFTAVGTAAAAMRYWYAYTIVP